MPTEKEMIQKSSSTVITVDRSYEAFRVDDDVYMFRLTKTSSKNSVMDTQVVCGFCSEEAAKKATPSRPPATSARLRRVAVVTPEAVEDYRINGRSSRQLSKEFSECSRRLKSGKAFDDVFNAKEPVVVQYDAELELFKTTSGEPLPFAVIFDILSGSVETSTFDLKELLKYLQSRSDIRPNPADSELEIREFDYWHDRGSGERQLEFCWVPEEVTPALKLAFRDYLNGVDTNTALEPYRGSGFHAHLARHDVLGIERFRLDLLSAIPSSHLDTSVVPDIVRRWPEKLSRGIDQRLVEEANEQDEWTESEDTYDFDDSILNALPYAVDGKVLPISVLLASFSQWNKSKRTQDREDWLRLFLAYGSPAPTLEEFERFSSASTKRAAWKTKVAKILRDAEVVNASITSPEDRYMVLTNDILLDAVRNGIDVSAALVEEKRAAREKHL